IRWDGYVGAGTDTVALNNTVRLAGSAIDYAGTGAVFDYNLYHMTGGSSFTYLWNSVNYDTLATFQAGTGQELHGKQQDPLFTDTQLHINSSSPGFDAGVIIPNFNDTSSAWPYSGAAPDIGSSEYWPQ